MYFSRSSKTKEGILKNISETHLFLDIGERTDIILLTKIIRVEIENTEKRKE